MREDGVLPTASAVSAPVRQRGAWRSAAPAIAVAAWGGNHFSPLLLMYREFVGYTDVQVTLFFACYILGLIPGFLIAGPISDTHGRKGPVTAALAFGVAGSFVLGLGDSDQVAMCAGRLLSGVSVAVAMVAGTSWITELSQHDADAPARARRASLTMTAGFGLGAGVSGALAQWGPAPTVLPYAVHIVLAVAAAVPLSRTPETLVGRHATISPPIGRRIPAAVGRRFLTTVAPMAPWVFSASALAFVVGPALVAERVGGFRVGFAALAAVVTLTAGAAVQPLVPWIARHTRGRQAKAGLLTAAAATAVLIAGRQPSLVLVAAVLFGIAYGICLVSGLVEVQAMADPRSRAALTGVYYSLTYLGFALPLVLAGLAHVASYTCLLTGVTAAVIACAVIVPRSPGAARRR